jgi:glycosyltransferase involved in cell wall biosynthesis
MRILHAARNIADQAGYVVRALRRMGHDAELWEYGENPFGYPADRTIASPERDARVLWDTFQEAIERFDVFHFHFGRTLFPNQWQGMPPFWDLPVYRMLGKKVFFTFHGTDCRIRRIHLEVNPWSYYRFSDLSADDDRTEKSIEVIRTYADRMFVVSVDYLHFVPEATVLPRIIDLSEWPEQLPEQRDAPVLLHVPSRRETKGTSFVLKGIEQLRSQGVPFEFRLLEGVPHEEAKRAIGEADAVIDNVITGDYELVSMEAMASGRVAVANVGPMVAARFPEVPVWSVDPDSFVERLRTLLGDVSLRRSLAARGRPYLAQYHDVPVIVGQLLQHYAEPSEAVPIRAMPDWLSLEGARRIETLERRISGLEQDLARSRRWKEQVEGRPGRAEMRPTAERDWKDLLPTPLRLFLRQQRARLSKRLGALR